MGSPYRAEQDREYLNARKDGHLVELQECGVSFAYEKIDGVERFWIDGYTRADSAALMEESSWRLKKWFHAQVLFWSRLEKPSPSSTTMTKSNMIALLDAKEIAARGTHGSLKEHHPRYMYQALQEKYKQQFKRSSSGQEGQTKKRKASPGHSPGTGSSKRPHTKSDMQTPATETPVIGPSIGTDVDSVRNSSRTVLNQPEPELGPQPGRSARPQSSIKNSTLSAIWTKKMQDVQTLVSKLRRRWVTGTYIVKCEALENRYPALEGTLKVHIHFNQDRSVTAAQGIYEGVLDFSLFKGTMIMGPTSDSVADYCLQRHDALDLTKTAEYKWLQAKYSGTLEGESDSGEEVDAEEEPDAEEGLDAEEEPDAEEEIDAEGVSHAEEKPNAKIADTGGESEIRRITDMPTRTPEQRVLAPEFHFEFRVNDEKQLFMRPGLVFADEGNIYFTEDTCLSFSGNIKLPMITDQLITFRGYKIHEKPQLDRLGMEIPSSVKYGGAWNQS